jgi:hypothetical protein
MPIFEFYKNNVDIVTKALNWSYTLINDSKITLNLKNVDDANSYDSD